MRCHVPYPPIPLPPTTCANVKSLLPCTSQGDKEEATYSTFTQIDPSSTQPAQLEDLSSVDVQVSSVFQQTRTFTPHMNTREDEITSTRQTTTKRTFLGCCLIIILLQLYHSSPLVFVLGNINNDCVRIYLPLLGDPFKLMCTFRCWYSWGHILGVVGCCVNHHPPIARIICF